MNIHPPEGETEILENPKVSVKQELPLYLFFKYPFFTRVESVLRCALRN